MKNQFDLHYAAFGTEPRFTYGYFYCDEKKVKMDHCKEGFSAYTWGRPGLFWTTKYIVLCPFFFSDKAPSLAELRFLNPHFRHIDDFMNSRALTIFHESYHWEFVSRPECDLEPEIYEALDATYLAREEPNLAQINAQSWALVGAAIWLSKTYEFADNKVPLPNPHPCEAVVVTVKPLDSPPDGWIAPIPCDAPEDYVPHGDNVVALTSVGDIWTPRPQYLLQHSAAPIRYYAVMHLIRYRR
jgi:hypothetical protein